VYTYVVGLHPSISKATVYRNLATAAESGEVSSIGVFNGAMHYDHNTHKHYHFVCDKCSKVIDVPDVELGKNLESLTDLKIKRIELTLRGLCKDCE